MLTQGSQQGNWRTGVSSDWPLTCDQPPTACTPPSTCTISPVVAGNQSESSATQARAAGSWFVRSQPSGARSCHTDSNCSKPGMDLAAMVRSGPAAMRLTLILYWPRYLPRYLAQDSRPALAAPIQS